MEPRVLLKEAHSDILPAKGDGTEERAAPRQSCRQERAASAASVGPSRNHASKTATRGSARKSKIKERTRKSLYYYRKF